MEAYIGLITMFAGNFAPRGWALCNGQLMSIAQNTALFSILGTTYGGDGQVTFALPNLQGRVPIHPGQSPGTTNYSLGETAGVENVTLLANNMPAHNHTVAATETASSSDPKDMVPANESASRTSIYGTPDGTTMAAGMIGLAGGSQPFSIVQPFQCINFIICTEGLFPSRN
jgi:microcystin-dependent protein